MGVLFSRSSPESQPLITPSTDTLPEPTSRFQKGIDVLAALKANKLPSQEQLNSFLRLVLHADVLDVDGVAGHGPVSDDVKKVVFDVRESVEAVLQIGMEKNDDDRVQDLLFECCKIEASPIHVETKLEETKTAIPQNDQPPTNEPMLEITQSTLSLIVLLLTSATFRLILSALLATAQGLVASTEKAVEDVAGQLEVGAQQVEKIAGADYFEKLREASGFVWEGMGETGEDDIADRRNPEHVSALRTILTILRKYTTKFTLITVTEPTVDLDAHLTRALDDVKILLERSASRTSLDPLLASLRSLITHLTTDPPKVNSELHAFFTDLGSWIDNALDHSEYVTSQEGTSSLRDLYTRARTLLGDSDVAGPSQDIHNISSLTSSFTAALSQDRALTRLTSALDAFSVDMKNLRHDALAPGKWREEVWRDLVEWVVPKILKALSSVSIPRVEYMDPDVDLALDSFLMTSADDDGVGTSASASLAPDHVELQNWDEVPLGDEDDSRTRTSARVHVDGLRASAKGVGYYLRYKGWWMRYSDEGVLDVSIGEEKAEGLAVDVDLETDSDAWRDLSPSGEGDSDYNLLFVVKSVHATIPGLSFTFSKSKHWILNKLFVRPVLSGSVGRRVLGGVVEGQVRSQLEALENVMRAVKTGAERSAKESVGDGQGGMKVPGLGDYWHALLEELTPSEDNTEEGAEAPHFESNLTTTLKGVVHTTTTQSSPSTPTETVLAIGAGAQLFPDKGGPYKEPPVPSPSQIAGEAMDEVREAVDGAVDVTRGLVESVDSMGTRMREDMEGAGERFGERESVERRKSGWRSSVFDF